MSSLVIFDTSIFIDQLRTGRHQARIQAVSGLVRTSAVVLSELWRGVTSTAEGKFLKVLQKNHPVVVPTATNWVESGQILSKLHNETGFVPHKLRDLHFDVLISLTVRSCGARLVTSNRSDFELIATYIPLRLEVWP